MRQPNTKCRVCGKEIYRRPSQILSGPVYCSRRCHGVSQRKTKACPVCGDAYWGHKSTCSRACANRRRRGVKYDGHNASNKRLKGWRLKERLARRTGGICERCGYANYNILQVHHILPKAKGGTDRVSNLKLLCPNCHMEVHYGFATYGGSSR